MHLTEEEAVRLGVTRVRVIRPKRSGREIIISVPVAAIGAPRMTRADAWKKRPCVLRYRAWKDVARRAAGRLPPADEVESLSWTATFEMPKSWSAKKRTLMSGCLHRSKPDRDNIDKAILDCLYPGGDAAIAQGSIQKVWGIESMLIIKIVLVRDV